MRFAAALALFSFTSLAQTPPPDVDEALRARVNEFFGYHVSGDFQKAWPMVAEDTKNEYFNSQKTLYQSFKIDSVKYMDDFTKAVVTLTVSEKKRISAQFQETVFTHPVSVLWKIENGKWCWYNDHTSNWVMPMGPSDPKRVQQQASGQPAPPVVTPEKLKERVQGIMGQSSVNKTDLKLATDKASSDQAVFHNGQGGAVRISLAPIVFPEGMTAKLDKNDLGADGDAVLKVEYKPKPDSKPPFDVTVSIIMEPFNRVFPVAVHFASAK